MENKEKTGRDKSLENLIPFNQMDADKAREIRRRAGIASGKVRRDKKTMRERFLALRDMPLPKDRQTKTVKTYGDAWAEAISNVILEGKAGAVEAMKLFLQQFGEDTAEKQEIKIVYDNKADDLMG